jgi:hypothetical protein
VNELINSKWNVEYLIIKNKCKMQRLKVRK